MKDIKLRKGFTLIELLIVITIIGILAAALIPRITTGTSKARDAKRQADLGTIATALELYAQNDNATTYPVGAGGCISAIDDIAVLEEEVSGGLPEEPSSSALVGGCAAGYYYKSIPKNGVLNNGYILVAQTEEDGDGEGYYLSSLTTVLTTAGAEAGNQGIIDGAANIPNLIDAANIGENNVYAVVKN